MLSRNQRISVRYLKQLRCISNGGVIVEKEPKDAIVHVESNGKSKRREPKEEDLENIWLKNLNKDNLKLYRKTSTGSFRKINLPTFFEKLKVILPDQFESKETVDKLSNENVRSESVFASPHMSEFLIQNMVTFPLLKSESEDFLGIGQDEVEEVGFSRYPSVTRILQETMSPESKERLEKWQNQMIQKMGLEKFQKLKQDMFNDGSKFHGALKKYLESGEEKLVSIDRSIEGSWKSVTSVLKDVSNVVMVEGSVCHPVLSYQGYVDCVASYRDVPYVIEWKKTTKKAKSIAKLYDAPVQACAYLAALSWRKDFARIGLRKCLLVIAYNSGEPADVFPIDLEDCQVYWSNFLHRLQSFWAREWSHVKSNDSRM